jgi:23S rRNA (uridine2552-2'-O)-methyltransferase
MSKRGGSSDRWRRRQQGDPFVDRAQREGWRSRAVFKLEEIQRRQRILWRGAHCVDLGAAPGGWSQLAARIVGAEGRIWAIDLLPMDPIAGVTFVQADFTTPEGLAQLRDALAGDRVDLVMSDLAPNISGQKAVDQPRSMGMAEEAALFAAEVLKPGGAFLVKLFQGEGLDAYVREIRGRFGSARLLKPRASRPESREIYLLASDYGMV